MTWALNLYTYMENSKLVTQKVPVKKIGLEER